MEFKLVAELENTANPETHSMVAVGRRVYIIDGNKIVEFEVPRETVWQKLWSLIKFW